MKRGGSLLKNFAILALLSSAVICWRFPNKRYKRPTITYDNCGLAKLVTSNRLQINLTYNNNMDCTVVLGLLETRAVKLSIDNFQVSVIHHHQILVHFKMACCPYFTFSSYFSPNFTMITSNYGYRIVNMMQSSRQMKW